MQPSVLFYDIETTPDLGYTFGPMYEAKIVKYLRYSHVLSIAWRWRGQKKVHVISQDEFDSYEADPYCDKMLLERFREELEKADIIVAHNNNFDVKSLRARMVYHDIEPFKKSKEYCTLRMARRDFKFPSNSLKQLAEFLNLDAKLETSSGLWYKILEECEPKHWREMRRYNKVDVEVLEQLFDSIGPWAKELTTFSGCTHCGSSDSKKKGWSWPSAAGWQFKRYQCHSCGRKFLDKENKRKHPDWEKRG